MTTDARGISLGPATITLASACTAIGTLVVVIKRWSTERSLVPYQLFKLPVTWVILAYFTVGLISGINATDIVAFVKEVFQRVLMLFLCVYLFAVGPRTPRALDLALLCFLPVGSIIAGISATLGAKSGFQNAVYMENLHKNAVGDSNAALILVCAAFLMTRCHPKFRWVFWLLTLVAVVGLVGSRGRSSFLGMVVGLVLMTISYRFKPGLFFGVILAITLGAGVLAIILPPEVIDSMFTTKAHSSNAVRITAYTEIWNHIKENPLNFCGWGNYAQGYRTSQIDPTTNVILHDWLQMGPIGAVLLIFILLLAIKLPLDNGRRLSIRDAPILASINLSALGVITLHAVHGMFDTFWVARGPHLAPFQFLGIAIFVRLWMDQEDDERRKQLVSQKVIRQG
jgi:O-antigen ligase